MKNSLKSSDALKQEYENLRLFKNHLLNRKEQLEAMQLHYSTSEGMHEFSTLYKYKNYMTRLKKEIHKIDNKLKIADTKLENINGELYLRGVMTNVYFNNFTDSKR